MRVALALAVFVLVAAIVFALWPHAPQVSAPPEPSFPVELTRAPAPSAAPVRAPAPPAPPVAAPVRAPVAVAEALPPRPPPPPPVIPEEPDPEYLQAIGVDPSELEPLDGGVLHGLDRDGIRGAVKEKLPEIKECYEAWLQQNPALAGTIKVDFRIAEIPGRDRGRVSRVTVLDGGLGHVAMEGCVRNVFKDLRFEAPPRGELRVTYPLNFSNPPPANTNAPPP